MKTIRAVFLLAILFPLSTIAAEVPLSWNNATQNTDGTQIPTDTSEPDALASTTIYWGACLADNTPSEPLSEKTVTTTVPGAAESTSVIITTPGRWCFVGVHTNNAGTNSDASNPAFKDVVNIPSPPENLVVEDEIVYYVIQRENRFALLPVGTIPAGSACIGTEYVNGYYAVPRESVTWSSNTQPLVVVARCTPQ